MEETDLDLAYMAGLFDGEGCIVIDTNKWIAKNGELRRYHFLEVQVCNTDEWAVRQFQFFFGGSIYWRADKIWVWQITSQKAAFALTMLLPYLHIKKAQAGIGIRFQERIGRCLLLTEEEMAVREAQKVLISNLNKRSITAEEVKIQPI